LKDWEYSVREKEMTGDRWQMTVLCHLLMIDHSSLIQGYENAGFGHNALLGNVTGHHNTALGDYVKMEGEIKNKPRN